ncbi:MAG: carboxymuconolactone decarboxylase family protein [Selenomonadaceae bacterium]|nr:carboxymuconolactone decarboxylase family protein [Selenomonadaceae bacterium]
MLKKIIAAGLAAGVIFSSLSVTAEAAAMEKTEKVVQTAGRNALGTFAPDFAHYNDDVLFGENWNNQDIDLKTRSIITVVSLMSMGITDSSLKYHLTNAKNHGVTQKEIAAIITHVSFYAGWPKAWAVFNLAKEVWAEDSAQK